MTPDGMVYGIELLNANEQLQRDTMGKLMIINEATGEHAELKLSSGWGDKRFFVVWSNGEKKIEIDQIEGLGSRVVFKKQ